MPERRKFHSAVYGTRVNTPLVHAPNTLADIPLSILQAFRNADRQIIGDRRSHLSTLLTEAGLCSLHLPFRRTVSIQPASNGFGALSVATVSHYNPEKPG